MSTRWPRTLFGVQIIYMRDHVARKVISIVTGGRGVWALLPNGSVATNDAEFFRWATASGSRQELNAAEILWRLGKLKKSAYQKLAAAYSKKQERREKDRLAGELKGYARQLGIALTKQQLSSIGRLTK